MGGGSLKREETHVDFWLIHAVLWQKPAQPTQLWSNYPPIKNKLKKQKITWWDLYSKTIGFILRNANLGKRQMDSRSGTVDYKTERDFSEPEVEWWGASPWIINKMIDKKTKVIVLARIEVSLFWMWLAGKQVPFWYGWGNSRIVSEDT